MPLAVGARLGPYEITGLLGAGGMGEVYRARDSKLQRDVAIKVLPEGLAHDTERLARFEREARTLASLNHPHIAGIYGLEESGGVSALVMELVEGEDLSQRVARGAVPLLEALPIAKQIAEALEAAHEQGIVHRDLKPANIKVRPDGTVKVLDFGLAKIRVSELVGQALSLFETKTIGDRSGGAILGTPAYMSPEQARGEVVDKRTDIWAFGCVLFEMLAGRRAFARDSLAETLVALVDQEPNWRVLPEATPLAVLKLLRRCLAKDRRQRLADVADARLDIEEVLLAPLDERAAVATSYAFTRGRVAVFAGIIMAAGAIGLVASRLARPVAEPLRLVRFSIDLPGQMSFLDYVAGPLAISRDGSRVAYMADQRLYLRALDQLDGTATPVPGTETAGPSGFARAPVFSPDGQWLAFWQEGQLRKVALQGGAPAVICDTVAPSGISWELNDDILIGGSLEGVLHCPASASGGKAEPLIAMKSSEGAVTPQMLPGGEWVLYVLIPSSANSGQGKVVVQSRVTEERRVLIEGASGARYLPTKHLVYGRGATLVAQPFDPGRLSLGGVPVTILNGVGPSADSIPPIAVSENGTLLYLPSPAPARASTTLVEVARDGSRSTLADVAGMAWYPRFSPEGTRLAFGVSAGESLADDSDLWVLEMGARHARTRVTYGGNNRYVPTWTRDGTRLTFADGGGPANRILSALADGSGGLQTVLDTGPRRFPNSWSPDGTVLAMHGVLDRAKADTRDILMLHVDGDTPKETPFVATPFEERGAIFSPNGRWVAYVSNKAGRNEIYARPYPPVPGGEVTISVGGGQEPVWAPSGRELFYRHDGGLTVVQIDESGTTLTAGQARPLFEDVYRLDLAGSQGGVANYDISRDGQRFVFVEEPRSTKPAAAQRSQLQLVLNWFEELKRLAPTK